MATVMEVMARLTGDASGMVKAWKDAARESKKQSDKIKVTGKQAKDALDNLTLPAAAIATGGVLVAKHLGNMASEAEQNVGAVESVFKGYADTVKRTSKSAATDVGISQSSYQQFASVVGSQLKNLGMPMGEVAGGTNDLIKKGADLASMFGGTTSEAVQALSSLLRGERDPIERYGVSMKEVDIKAKMAQMGLSGLSGKAEKQAKLTATLAILEQQTADATGNFAREADTAAGAQQRANAQWEDAQVKLGTVLLPIMTKLAQMLSKLAGWLAENSTLVMTLGGVLMGAVAPILAIAGAMKVWSMYTDVLTLANYALGTSMKAIPVFWIITAIMALVAGFILAYNKVGWFREAVDKAWAGIKKAVAFVVNWFKETAGPAIGSFFRGAGDVAGRVAGAIGRAWNGMVEVIRTVVDWFKGAGQNFRDNVRAIGRVFTWLWQNSVVAAFEGIRRIVRGVVGWFRTYVQPVIDGVIRAVGAVFGWLYKNIVKPYFRGVFTVIKGVWLLIRGIFQVMVSVVKNVLAPAFRWFGNKVIKPVFQFIGGWIKDKIQGVRNVFSRIINFVRGALASAFRWYRDRVIIPVFKLVHSFISDKIEKVRGVFNKIIRFIRGTFATAWRWLRDNVVKPVFNGIRNFISERIDRVRATFRKIIDFIKTTLGNAFKWLKNTIVDPIFGGIARTISNVWKNKIKPVFDTLKKAVREGIPAAFRKAKEFVGNVWGGIKDVAMKPVKFVVNRVINDGLIGTFNKIAKILPGVDKLPEIKWFGGGGSGASGGGSIGGGGPIRGFAKGGYATPGMAVVGEKGPELVDFKKPGRVYNNRQLRAATDPQAATGSSVYGGIPSFTGALHSAMNRANALRISPHGGARGPWALDQAAKMWNGLAGINVSVGTGNTGLPTVYARQATSVPFPSIPNWAGYYSGSQIYLNPSAGMGGLGKRTVAAHEIGHALGLPHAMATGAHSIMNYNNMYKHNSVTAADGAALRSIYGPPLRGAQRFKGNGVDEGPSIMDRAQDMLNAILDKFKTLIPGSGIMEDIAFGLAKKVSNSMFSLFDGGGMFKKGMIGMHNSTKPDAVLTDGQWNMMRTIALNSGGNRSFDGMPELHVHLHGIDTNSPDEIVKAGKTAAGQIYRDVKIIMRGGVHAGRA